MALRSTRSPPAFPPEWQKFTILIWLPNGFAPGLAADRRGPGNPRPGCGSVRKSSLRDAREFGCHVAGKCSQEPLPTVISRSGPVTAGGAGRLIPAGLPGDGRAQPEDQEGDRRPSAGVEEPRPAQVPVPPPVTGADAPGIELGTGAYRPAVSGDGHGGAGERHLAGADDVLSSYNLTSDRSGLTLSIYRDRIAKGGREQMMAAAAWGADDIDPGLCGILSCAADLLSQLRRGLWAKSGGQWQGGPRDRSFGGRKGPGHWGGGFGGPWGGWWPGPPGPPGPGRGPKAGRGDVRAAILALLREGPRNGYQIMSEIEERSGGAWRPSPGRGLSRAVPARRRGPDRGRGIRRAGACSA